MLSTGQVFYPADSNAADDRCRWLPEQDGYDCPFATFLPAHGSPVHNSSMTGTGSFLAGNRAVNESWGGGAGCHFSAFDTGAKNLSINQVEAHDTQGRSMVAGKDCQCNPAFRADPAGWASQCNTTNILNRRRFPVALPIIVGRIAVGSGCRRKREERRGEEKGGEERGEGRRGERRGEKMREERRREEERGGERRGQGRRGGPLQMTAVVGTVRLGCMDGELHQERLVAWRDEQPDGGCPTTQLDRHVPRCVRLHLADSLWMAGSLPVLD